MSESPSDGASLEPDADRSSALIEDITRLKQQVEALESTCQSLRSEVEVLRKSEARLRVSEAQLAAIFAKAEVGISEIAPSGHFRRVNDTLCRILGRSREELLTLGVADVTHPEDLPRSLLGLTGLLETGVPVSLDKRYVRPDGELVWANSALSRMECEGEISILAVTADLTARKANEQWLRLLSDAVPQIIWMNDASGTTTYFNKRWYEFSGLSEEESRDGSPDLLHPEDCVHVLSRWDEASSKGVTFEAEYRLRRYDGQYRWFIGRTIPLRDESGRVTSWFGTGTDIHDLKQTESALAVERERLRLIMDSSSEHAIFSTDLDLHVTHWGGGAEQILGYSAEEMIGAKVDILYSPEDLASQLPAAEAAEALTSGRAGEGRWQARKDGSRFWAQRVILPMKPGKKEAVTGFVHILTDETEREKTREAERRSLEALEKAHAAAEAAGRAKDHFLAVLSHELRTPLTPVSMIIGEVLQDPALPESMRSDLEAAHRNVLVECHLIDDLLDLSRIVHGKFAVVHRRFDLQDSIRSAVDMVKSDIQDKGQILTLDLLAEPVPIRGDAVRLQQVVWNLLKNATKFTPQSGLITLRLYKDGTDAVTEISDNGIGIKPELLERIFTAFDQGGQEITRRYGGLGLGLAISSATLAAHGSRLLAASPGPGQGATFSFRLLLAD